MQAMADAIALVVPADTVAYMKGGSIDWNGFHCLAVAGQMIVRDTPVTYRADVQLERQRRRPEEADRRLQGLRSPTSSAKFTSV